MHLSNQDWYGLFQFRFCCFYGRFKPDLNMSSLCSSGLKGTGLVDQITKFGLAISAWIEVRCKFSETMAHASKGDPTVFIIKLGNCLAY